MSDHIPDQKPTPMNQDEADAISLFVHVTGTVASFIGFGSQLMKGDFMPFALGLLVTNVLSSFLVGRNEPGVLVKRFFNGGFLLLQRIGIKFRSEPKLEQKETPKP